MGLGLRGIMSTNFFPYDKEPRAYPELLTSDADEIFIMLGGNDAKNNDVKNGGYNNTIFMNDYIRFIKDI